MRLENLLVEKKYSPSQLTHFMETSSCIGIICGGTFAGKIKRFLGSDGKGADSMGDLFTLLEGVKGYLKDTHDWNSAGVDIINALEVGGTQGAKDAAMVNVCFNLIVGMDMFVQAEWSGMIKGKRYFVHGSIADYYKAEKFALGDLGKTKANTTDVVICNVPAKRLMRDMYDGGARGDNSEKFVITGYGSKFIQISLKKDDGMAQLGKITTKVRTLYDIEDMKDVVQFFINDSFMMEPWVTMNSLNEGPVWNRIKSIAPKMKSLFTAAMSSIYKRFRGKIPTKHIKAFRREIGLNEKVWDIDKLKPNDRAFVDAVTEKPEQSLDKVDSQIDKLSSMLRANGKIPFKVEYVNKGSLKNLKPKESFRLTGNYSTLLTMQAMVQDTANINKNISVMIGDMFYGGTKLPMWKVFGWFNSVSYHHMGTLQTFIGDKKLEGMDVLGIRIAPSTGSDSSGSTYAMYMYLLEDIVDGNKHYITVRTGTSSSSHPTYILEGIRQFVLPEGRTLQNYIDKDKN